MGEPFCYVYILANRKNGTLYVGVTSSIVARVHQHKSHAADGFTKRYSVDRLVYFEAFAEIGAAILREKHIKKWNRAWKVRLIEERNPDWIDLYPEISA
jgi:putative endonuclease